MSTLLISHPGKIMLPVFRLMLVTAICFVFSGYRQTEYVLNGSVTDETGVPVPFATIVIKGTTSGIQSDVNGKFHLTLTKLPASIVVSAIGFAPFEQRFSESSFKGTPLIVNIILKNKERNMEEVVVTGYASGEASFAGSYYSRKKKASAGRSAAGASMAARGDIKESVKSVKADYRVKDAARPMSPGDKPGRTKLLTAGELNDFKKWKMWEDYNQNEFEQHSKRWGLSATKRFCVQLQNKDLAALTGKKVFLLNKLNGDTLWSAVTDNTGKAELWQSFAGEQAINDLEIKAEGATTSYAAVPFSQGINKIVINAGCSNTNKVEIAFLVDATGSMQDEIDYLKEELQDILLKVTKKDPSLDMYTGAVFYRDKSDEYVTVTTPMKKGVTDVISFIQKQNAAGGGDYPEALHSGLGDAINTLTWSSDARAKIIFLLMDAPPHDEDKAEMARLIQQAAANGIRMVPVACSGTDKATEFIMRSMALATNGTYLFLTDDSGIGNSHIKPTTDEFKVELLNDLLQRTIEQMCFVHNCATSTRGLEPVSIVSNPLTVQVFPNPTKGMVTLKTNKKLREIFVLDFAGKILFRVDVGKSEAVYAIDLGGLPSSTYIIQYVTTDNKTGGEKVILVN